MRVARGTSLSSKARAGRGAWWALALGFLLVAASGCSAYVQHGRALYADARYIEAAEVFERTEERVAGSTPTEQAEYGLYRGLTLLVLGDQAGAARWLNYSHGIERSNPGALRGDQQELLSRGFTQLSAEPDAGRRDALATHPPRSQPGAHRPSRGQSFAPLRAPRR